MDMIMDKRKISSTRERLLEYMSEYDLTQADLARITGLNKSVISLYVRGEREPMQNNIATMSMRMDVDPAWLMGLDVAMKKNDIPYKYDLEVASMLNRVKNEPNLRNFVLQFLSLSDKDQSTVANLVNSLYSNK